MSHRRLVRVLACARKRLIRGKVTLGSQCFSSLSAYRCFVDVRYRSVFKVLTHGFYVLFLRLIYLLVKFSLPFIYSIIVVWGLKILCLCCKIWSNFFYPLPSYAFPSLSLIVHYILVLLLYHRWLRMKILTVCCKRWYNFLIHRFYVHSFAFFTRWLYCGLYLLYYYCLWLKILVCFKRWSYFFIHRLNMFSVAFFMHWLYSDHPQPTVRFLGEQIYHCFEGWKFSSCAVRAD